MLKNQTLLGTIWSRCRIAGISALVSRPLHIQGYLLFLLLLCPFVGEKKMNKVHAETKVSFLYLVFLQKLVTSYEIFHLWQIFFFALLKMSDELSYCLTNSYLGKCFSTQIFLCSLPICIKLT